LGGTGNTPGRPVAITFPLSFAASAQTHISGNGDNVSEPIHRSFTLSFDGAGKTGHEATNGPAGATVVGSSNRFVASFQRAAMDSSLESDDLQIGNILRV
jgi:hypothetical protein